jgi:tetratricopeptide (TPR) repeat protein
MFKKYISIILVLFGQTAYMAYASDEWINETINLTINTDFDGAFRIIYKEIEHDPKSYRGWFYIAATHNSKMTHFENDDGFAQFDKAIDKTIELIDKQFDNNKNLSDSVRAQLLFYMGSAYGYRAYQQGRNGQYFAAISNGLKSVGYLNESLENDSTLYGAYLGIGVYKYWRYSRLNFISWLPFVPDDRDEGIAMINIAIANDSLSRYMAMHQLIYILLDYGKFEEAIVFGKLVVEKYPSSQFMWWANAHAYYKAGIFQEAEKSYWNLYQLIRGDKNKNITHLIKCLYKMAVVAHNLTNYKLCEEYCEMLEKYHDAENLTGTAEDILSDAEDLRMECQEQLRGIK